jgi:hypothetical protein
MSDALNAILAVSCFFFVLTVISMCIAWVVEKFDN